MKRYTTITDIANALGLSTSTVSRALTDSWEIKKETRELVLKTAREMDYHPNLSAKNLLNRSSGTIGVIVPEFETGFFTRVILGIQDTLSEYGFHLLITQSNESSEQEKTNLELLLSNRVEGVIVSICKEGGNEEAFREVIASGLPVVFFNRVYPDVDAPKVIVNDEKMAYLAVKQMIEDGARRIMHLKGPDGLSVSRRRERGYRQAMSEAALEVDESFVVSAGMFMKEGEKTMAEILSREGLRPDGIFAFNDNLAVGAMKVAKAAGLKIPEQIRFFGFSEVEIAKIVEPNLSSVMQPTYEMGKCAAKLLLEQLETKIGWSPRTVCLDAELNIRESSNNTLKHI